MLVAVIPHDLYTVRRIAKMYEQAKSTIGYFSNSWASYLSKLCPTKHCCLSVTYDHSYLCSAMLL